MATTKRERRRETRAYKWFHDLLRLILGPLMLWFYRLRAENLQLFRRVRPPYIVIPNHVMTWDPLIFSFFIRDPIYFVASDANFRSSFVSWWLRRVGAIAKSKLMDDFATLRTIMRLLRSGKVVGLFAEGQRTWDGATQKIIPSTAKLVKVARVPVVVPVMKGGYYSLPRWAFRSRRGRIVVEYRLALTAEEAGKLSLEEITERIERTMEHNEADYQQQVRVPYPHPRAAEPMQLVLFWCPRCHALNRMDSEGRLLFCRDCGYTVKFTLYGQFRLLDAGPTPAAGSSEPVPTPPPSIRAWSLAQNAYLERHLAKQHVQGTVEAVFSDPDVLYSTGYRLGSLAQQGSGRLSLHVDGIRFRVDGEAERFFGWGEIRALNVVYQDQLEFYFRRRLCVFQFPGHDTSGYKYLLCGEQLARLWLGQRLESENQSRPG